MPITVNGVVISDAAIHAEIQHHPAPSRELDVVEMSLASRPHHVGVYLEVDGGRVLTSVEGAGVVAQSLGSLKLHGWNIVACYRRRST